MFVLAVIQPPPSMCQPQIKPQFVERRISLPQMPLPGRAALALGVEQRFLKIQRRIHHPLYHCLPVNAWELLSLGQQPGQQIESSSQNHHLIGHHFVKRELRCPAYLRYVDDLALFSDSKRKLWQWKEAVLERLTNLRLAVHQNAQVAPVASGIPWLGFIAYPTHRRLKAHNVHNFNRRMRTRWQSFCTDEISFAEFNASVRGWINHARHGDTWGLRRHLLGRPLRVNRSPRHIIE